MKIISASWVLTCDANGTIVKDGAVVYDKKIIKVASKNFIKEHYPKIEIEDLGENSLLMPGLINSHVHLEFSSNSTTLKYGNFINWLNSVIKNRENLIEKATEKLISQKKKKKC